MSSRQPTIPTADAHSQKGKIPASIWPKSDEAWASHYRGEMVGATEAIRRTQSLPQRRQSPDLYIYDRPSQMWSSTAW